MMIAIGVIVMIVLIVTVMSSSVPVSMSWHATGPSVSDSTRSLSSAVIAAAASISMTTMTPIIAVS